MHPTAEAEEKLQMVSEDELMTETTRIEPVGNAESSKVEQDASKKRQLVYVVWLCSAFVMLAIIIAVGAIFKIWDNGKFPPHECPSEWIGYKNKCYFISEDQRNWTSSQTFCSKNESLLVIFENQQEMLSLAKRLQIDDSWIGLHKKGESFYWENGIALDMD
ncbi:PREDICTED: C-type lectin domain family 2 member A-like, partial [Mesitornis unicolor]|uniref:C-type lectin domain family 2 member A-like n=1 Tax=Mesitornis unicolor TaxID=54374 RepID=UPI000528A781